MPYAILSKNTSTAIGTSPTLVSFTSAVESGANFWDAAQPSRITIPADVTLVELFAYFYDGATTTTTVDSGMELWKNGTFLHAYRLDNDGGQFYGMSFGIFSVVEGDYFDLRPNFTVAGNYAANNQFFSAATIEREGLVSARLASDTNPGVIGAPTTLSWATPSIDTLATHNGTTGFVVPAGVTAAIVSFTGATSTFDTSPSYGFNLKVNGTTVRTNHSTKSWWGMGPPCFGVVQVAPGDVITLEAYDSGAANLQAANYILSIEYLAAPTGLAPSFATPAATLSGADAASHVITLPAGYSAGELLVVTCLPDGAATVTGGTGGWTRLIVRGDVNVFYKIATGSDALTVTLSGSEGMNAIAFAVQNADTVVAQDGSLQFATTAIDPPAITLDQSREAIFVAGFVVTDVANVTAYPAGYDLLQVSSMSIGGNDSHAIAARQTTALTEDPGAFTTSAS